MSGDSVRNVLVGLFLVVVLGGMGWFLHAHFEPSWEPVVSNSDAAAKNPMLAAQRLLQRRGYQVKTEQTLSMALFQPLPEGTLILSEGGDSMLVTQSHALLSWVEHGNTLIVTPGWQRRPLNFDGEAKPKPQADPKAHPPARDNAAEESKDAITAHFGVALGPASERGAVCRQIASRVGATQAGVEAAGKQQVNFVDCVASVTLPGVAHPLRLDASQARLVNVADKDADGKPNDDDDDDEGDASAPPDANSDAPPDTPTNAPASAAQSGAHVPLIADDEAKAVRIYAHGRGRVVILAEHYFENYRLPAYDHGELLLGLAALNPHGKNVTLIQRVDIASWLSILWHAAPFAICTLAAFLLLWAWSSMRRFGPQLPDPDDRRRALLEHVDASGRWLWKSIKGREIMLAAMRNATLRTLARRIPELRKLPQERQIERIAADGKMNRVDLERALLDAPGRLPIEFTRQIQTLQELRAHYER